MLAAINGARTATGRDEKREGKEREREQARDEWEGERRRRGPSGGEARACKGYEKRILSSLFGMQDERSGLYAPRPFFLAKREEKKKGRVSLRVDYSMYREPRATP